jgi:site-specific DNA recombinase
MSKKSTKLIPAVAYLRKSTKGERADGRQKQEKSIAQQRTEITKLAAGRFQILDWFEDDGISGWKRGLKRPAFQQMLDGVKDLGAQAILCDHIDRFSRAKLREVRRDVDKLLEAGVRWIVTANRGEYDIGNDYEIGEELNFTFHVWNAHEESRQKGRRVALARRNAAMVGKRPGGRRPYGWISDGKDGLKHGDPQHVRTVLWIFDQYANKGQSPNWICEQLNQVKKIPAPKGKKWYVKTVKDLLAKSVYIGELAYGQKRNCQFYTIDAKGEVVELDQAIGLPGKVYRHAKAYQPMVDQATFKRAQRRLSENTTGRQRRKRVHALSGILYCEECGHPLYGTKTPSGIVYRCSANQMLGRGTCEQWMVREDRILPFLLKLLGEELTDIKELLAAPPAELVAPNKQRAERQKRLQRDRDNLASKIKIARDSLYETSDKQTRKEIDRDITAMRDELTRIDAELVTEPVGIGYNRADLEALTQWWEEFNTKAVSVPVNQKAYLKHGSMVAHLNQDPFKEEAAILVDPLAANEALRQLGTKVTLRWKTVDKGTKRCYKTPKGKRRYLPSRQHVFAGGRFQLGQQKGKLPSYLFDTSACPSTCSCWSRRSRGRSAASPC